jgi:hypothetical protein
LKFNGGTFLEVDGVGDNPPYDYKKTISLSAETLIQQLTGAPAGASDKAAGPIEVTIVALSAPYANQEIGRIGLQGLGDVNSTKLISKLSGVKGKVKNSGDAAKIAREALGLQNQEQSKDTEAQKAAVDYIVSVLKASESSRDKFLTFFKLAAGAALTYWGVPAHVR